MPLHQVLTGFFIINKFISICIIRVRNKLCFYLILLGHLSRYFLILEVNISKFLRGENARKTIETLRLDSRSHSEVKKKKSWIYIFLVKWNTFYYNVIALITGEENIFFVMISIVLYYYYYTIDRRRWIRATHHLLSLKSVLKIQI